MIKPVVCQQIEIYKEIYNKEPKTPISIELLKKLGRITTEANPSFIANETLSAPKFPIYVEDDEFLSQIKFMRDLMKPASNLSYYNNINIEDPYNTRMRETNRGDELSKLSYTFKNVTKGITENIEDNKNNWINNYNYNKIFNIRNPPIKSVLEKYLLDDNFNNFYLFFVVSNNKKEDGSKEGLETCDKQIQLIYDTRKFMDMIANRDAKGMSKEECDAL